MSVKEHKNKRLAGIRFGVQLCMEAGMYHPGTARTVRVGSWGGTSVDVASCNWTDRGLLADRNEAAPPSPPSFVRGGNGDLRQGSSKLLSLPMPIV